MTTLVSCELDRIATLRQLLEHDPKSSFARYGLAMELIKSGQLADAAPAQQAETLSRLRDQYGVDRKSVV